MGKHALHKHKKMNSELVAAQISITPELGRWKQEDSPEACWTAILA